MKEHARIVRLFLPAAVAVTMAIVVNSNWQLMTAHETLLGTCHPCRYILSCASSSIGLTMIFLAIRFAERLRSESESLLMDLQTAVVVRATKLNVVWRGRSVSYPGRTYVLRRMFRRLPLRIRIYPFFWIQNGCGLTIVQETIENSVNVIVLAATHDVAKWLL